jgi:hypothetical protein
MSKKNRTNTLPETCKKDALMKIKPFPLMLAVIATALTVSAGSAKAQTTLFWEDFDGYTNFPSQDPAGDPVNAGIPKLSEGADEVWFGGRFARPDDGTIDQDLAVQQAGGGGNSTPVGRNEDEAGLLFKVSTLGFSDVDFSFDYRTFSASGGDRLRVGYLIGDLPNIGGACSGNGEAGCFMDFYNDPDYGNGSEAAALAWWNSEWTEVVNHVGNTWQTYDQTLAGTADKENIWFAFWLDNGESDHGKIDNVHVMAMVVPEPVASALFLLGGGAMAAVRLR